MEKQVKRCKACGGCDHVRRSSKKCRLYMTPSPKPITTRQWWRYICALVAIMVTMWLATRYMMNTKPTIVDSIELYNETETETQYIDQPYPSMYLSKDIKVQASQDIFFMVSYIATLLIFKSYLTDLSTLKSAVLILATEVSKLN